MTWTTCLRGDPVPWLLEDGNPCVRYRTLTELLEGPADDAEVCGTVEAIWTYPPAASLLSALAEVEPFPPNTIWWQKLFKDNRGDLDTLSRFGIPGGHPAIQRACDQWLEVELIPEAECYPKQMVAGLTRYANPEDPRLREKVRFVLSNEPFVDGNRPGVLRYGGRGCCCGSHSCYMAAIKALWAVIGLPPQHRTPEVRQFIRRGAGFLAAHRLYQSSHRPGKAIARRWLDLHLPFALGCDTDLLDVLDIATQVGLEGDQSIAPALDLLLSKQNAKGRWCVEAPARWAPSEGRLAGHVSAVEAVGQESKWITLGALLVLKRCERFLAGASRGDLRGHGDLDTDDVLSRYPFEYDSLDEERTKSHWAAVGIAPVLDRLVALGKKRGLAMGWHWDFVMGPEFCPEWCAGTARWIPRKGDRKSWPVSRVYFLCRRGQFSEEGLSEKLGIPTVDEAEKARFNRMFWPSLWRIRVSKWRDRYDEVGVTIRDVKEFSRLRTVMDAALTELTRE